MAGLDTADGSPHTSCEWPQCTRGLALLRQLEEARSDLRRQRETTDAVSDANAFAALLMAEVEDAKQLLEEKNRALETQAMMLADAIEKSKAADLAKNAFLANVSHEIRTPLHGIIGMSELALETAMTDEQREYLTTIRSCSDFLLQLINDVLDFSKLQAEKLTLTPIPFEIRDTLYDSVRAVAAQAHKKGLELICDVEEDVPAVLLGDPGRLRQVVLNLLSNAVKFTSEGEVVLRAALDGTRPSPEVVELAISVRDTGIGIAAENQQRVFEPFTQADASICRSHGGTGLGLTICERIVRLMGGSIWLSSTPGQGSEFHFTARFGAPMACFSPPSTLETIAATSVLIVSHNETNRRVLETFLKRRGMSTVSVTEMETAIAAANEGAGPSAVDFVLVDCCPKFVNGGRLRDLMDVAPFRRAHTILLTSTVPGCTIEADARLIKPVKSADLLALMARLSTPAPQNPTPPETRHDLPSSLHILLAEDNPVNQLVASRMLQKRGHTVQIAKDGEQAVNLHTSAEFDLILMDMHMPRMNGLEASRAIRQRERGSASRTPIIALTADSTDEAYRACRDAGMDGYLAKPIHESQMADMVASITKNRT